MPSTNRNDAICITSSAKPASKSHQEQPNHQRPWNVYNSPEVTKPKKEVKKHNLYNVLPLQITAPKQIIFWAAKIEPDRQEKMPKYEWNVILNHGPPDTLTSFIEAKK